MRTLLLIATLVIASFVIVACGRASAPLLAENIVVTIPMPGKTMSAAYLSLTNNSDADISVSSITSPQFESVEMHETLVEDGIARMRRIERLALPARTTVVFERGGKHLMLMRPTGEVQDVAMNFYDGDVMLLEIHATASQRNK